MAAALANCDRHILELDDMFTLSENTGPSQITGEEAARHLDQFQLTRQVRDIWKGFSQLVRHPGFTL
jgi:hypothetical protein